MNFGDVLLARLPFPDGGGFKLRPVLVIHEHGDGDLLVVPVTTHDPRGVGDTPIALWQEAGLRVKMVPATRIGEARILPRFGGWHHFPAGSGPFCAFSYCWRNAPADTSPSELG